MTETCERVLQEPLRLARRLASNPPLPGVSSPDEGEDGLPGHGDLQNLRARGESDIPLGEC